MNKPLVLVDNLPYKYGILPSSTVINGNEVS